MSGLVVERADSHSFFAHRSKVGPNWADVTLLHNRWRGGGRQRVTPTSRPEVTPVWEVAPLAITHGRVGIFRGNPSSAHLATRAFNTRSPTPLSIQAQCDFMQDAYEIFCKTHVMNG